MIQDIAPHRLDNAYRTDAVPESGDAVFLFHEKKFAVREENGALSLPRVGEFAGESEYRYLFALDGAPHYLRAEETALPKECRWIDARELRHSSTQKELSFAAATAQQLALWYRDNAYCGTCGSPTEIGTTERSIVCPRCGRAIYPRIIPAVIVGVTNGDYLLHTKYARSRGVPFYALVAGFTEIGETFEECVAREVMEETGLSVKNIRYFKSQPWGVVDDILAGFYCDVDGDPTIRIDENELCEGVWIHRDDIVGQPDDASLTHHMMMTFKEGKEPHAFRD